MSESKEQILDLCNHADRLTEAMREASRRAIALHRAYDRPLVGFKDGEVVYISADEAEQNLNKQ